MKEPEIVVLSGETRCDQWENIFFKDNAGKEHKVGAKNKKKDEIAKIIIANPGRAVEIVYDTVTGKEGKVFDYIKLVEIQVDGAKITEQQVAPPATKPAPKPESKNRAFALSYAKDIGCAKIQMGGNVTPAEILNIAALFTFYLDEGYSQEAIKIYAQTQKELKKED